MLLPLIIAGTLVGATVCIHAFGTALLVELAEKFGAPLSSRATTTQRLRLLMATAIFLIILHTLEISLWAFAYLLLPEVPALDTFEKAYYFSIVTFTTVGYGDITLDNEWRILSGIEAADGILLFGWSTAMLFAVVQRIFASEPPSGGKRTVQ
jgi:hypothetical protein